MANWAADWSLSVYQSAADGFFRVYIDRYTYRPDDEEGLDPVIETRVLEPDLILADRSPRGFRACGT